jgi:hypothetical protein
MIKWIALLMALPLGCLHAQTLVNSFDDIQFWAGSGTNRAALVIEWPDVDSPKSVAWGYRWNGSATAQDMMFALAGVIAGGPTPSAGSDPRLQLELNYYGGNLSDYFVEVIRFDQRALGGGWTSANRLMPGYDGVDFNALYFRYSTSQWTSATFTQSWFGPAGVPLQDGAWVGWIYTDGFEMQMPFVQPFAAPGSDLPPVPKPLASLRMANGSAIVSAPSETDFKYQLAYSGEIAGAWTNQPPVLNGTGAALSFTNTPLPGTPQRFYRIVVTR